MSASNRWWRDYEDECREWRDEQWRAAGVIEYVYPKAWVVMGRPIVVRYDDSGHPIAARRLP